MALMFAVPLILYMNELDPKPPTQDICNKFSHLLVVHQTSACLDSSCNSYIMSYDLFKSQYIVEKYLICQEFRYQVIHASYYSSIPRTRTDGEYNSSLSTATYWVEIKGTSDTIHRTGIIVVVSLLLYNRNNKND